MQKDRQDTQPIAIADGVLPGAHHALDDRVHELEVRGIGSDAHRDRLARARVMHAARAEVVLHVARAVRQVRIAVLLELREDLGQRFSHDVVQHVQATTVWHADNGLGHAGARRVGKQPAEHRDQRLDAFDGEAFVPEVARVQEALEALGFDQALEQALSRRRLEGRAVARGLHALLQPVLARGVGDVHVLGGHAAAVGLA